MLQLLHVDIIGWFIAGNKCCGEFTSSKNYNVSFTIMDIVFTTFRTSLKATNMKNTTYLLSEIILIPPLTKYSFYSFMVKHDQRLLQFHADFFPYIFIFTSYYWKRSQNTELKLFFSRILIKINFKGSLNIFYVIRFLIWNFKNN